MHLIAHSHNAHQWGMLFSRVFIERMAAFQIINIEGARSLHTLNIMSEFFIATYMAWISTEIMGANLILLFVLKSYNSHLK